MYDEESDQLAKLRQEEVCEIFRIADEAADVPDFELSQCCGAGYEMNGVTVYHDIKAAVRGKDVICTASLLPEAPKDFKDCRVTKVVMDKANQGAVLNPCPHFTVERKFLRTRYSQIILSGMDSKRIR